jgi:hypothetical protein
MNRLDKDIKLAEQQLSSVIEIARDEGISPANFVVRKGFVIPIEKDFSYSDRINFRMKPNYDKYGKDTVYYFDKWSAQLVILLGTYSDEDLKSTSNIALKDRYLENKNNTFVYLSWNFNTGIIFSSTNQADSWSGYSYNNLWGYSFKPTITLMNWKNSPF